MSQRDLVAELRAARPVAPPEVRARVRLIAAGAPAPPHRFTWRRALVVAVPVAAAIAAAVVVARPSHDRTAVPERSGGVVTQLRAAPPVHTPSASVGAADKAFAVPSPKTRVQLYTATLGLRVESSRAVSDGVKQALRITTSLGGYSTAVHASTEGKRAAADLTLRVPRDHVQEAVARLSQIGTITDENVSTVDKQSSLDATDRLIARLQKRLADLRALPQSADGDRRIAALVTRIERLQRGEAATRRAARFATIRLHLGTAPPAVTPKHGHGPLHGVGVALTWLGIGAVYALAVGLPVAVVLVLLWLAARTLRRRQVDALLSRS